MKKIFYLILALSMIFTLTIPLFAIAEETATAPGVAVTDSLDTTTDADIPTEPFTWEYLATLAGATVATLLIVQFCKVPLDKVWKIPTRVFVYIVALAILLVATAFTTGLTIDNAPLAAVNAFLVALTAYGSYEITFAKIEK